MIYLATISVAVAMCTFFFSFANKYKYHILKLCVFFLFVTSYAGHGSGLQYINGRNITKQQMHSVVFLFGCDSSRLHSNGLYSELLGPHLYYQAAMW